LQLSIEQGLHIFLASIFAAVIAEFLAVLPAFDRPIAVRVSNPFVSPPSTKPGPIFLEDMSSLNHLCFLLLRPLASAARARFTSRAVQSRIFNRPTRTNGGKGILFCAMARCKCG